MWTNNVDIVVPNLFGVAWYDQDKATQSLWQ